MKPGNTLSIPELPGVITIVRPIKVEGETIAGQTIPHNMRGNLWLADRNHDGVTTQIVVCTEGMCADEALG